MENAENNLIDKKVAIINAKNLQNGIGAKPDEREFSPPDGGSRAWLVMIGSFFCNGILFGVINSYSVLQDEFYSNLKSKNISDASSKAGKRPIYTFSHSLLGMLNHVCLYTSITYLFIRSAVP